MLAQKELSGEVRGTDLSCRSALMARLLATVVVATLLLAVPARPADYNSFLKEIFPTGPGPSGSNNPVVPLNTTMAQLLQQSYASGLLTPDQVAAVKALKLGVYSYYWAIVGDPVQRVSALPHSFVLIVSRSPRSPASTQHELPNCS